MKAESSNLVAQSVGGSVVTILPLQTLTCLYRVFMLVVYGVQMMKKFVQSVQSSVMCFCL